MPNREGKTRIAVIFGGRSAEHAISCVSAASVMRALDPERYDVVPVGITRTGQWVLTDGDVSALEIHDRTLPEVPSSAKPIAFRADPSSHELTVVEPGAGAAALSGVDVVFPVLHGAYGEDGTIQGLLEIAGVPYVGAGVLGSAVSLDKEYMKKLLAAEGLPVGPFAVVRPGRELPLEERERLGLPVFVKPATGGSSVGMTRVDDWADLDAAIAMAREVDPKVLVETQIVGREVECGVLESLSGGAPEVSVPAEIRLVRGHDWYDFEAKYLDDACEFDIPAQLPEQVTAEVRALAGKAFEALDGSGLARVDFFIDADGAVILNEVNTIPGFTEISLFAKAWAATGKDLPAVLDHLVQLAMRRVT